MSASLASVHPGTVSGRRPVPAGIVRPEYVDKPAPAPFTGSEVKDEETIARMRVAGRVAAQAMATAAEAIAPGVTTDEIDAIAHEFLLDHHAYPSTLGYRGFPKSVCTSVNEVVCHGIPDDRPLRDGDIVNIDITAFVGGVHGDTDATYLVGEVGKVAAHLGVGGQQQRRQVGGRGQWRVELDELERYIQRQYAATRAMVESPGSPAETPEA